MEVVTLRMGLRARAFVLASCWVAFSLWSLRQSAESMAQEPGARSPVFEVISVKPSKLNNLEWRETAEGLSAETTLKGLILNAYGIRRPDQIVGLPGWGDTAPFHVEAKMDANEAAMVAGLSKEQAGKERQLMLQSLLADRFGLRIHHVTKEGSIYALVIAKGGSKLTESSTTPSMSVGYGELTAQAMPIGSLVTALTGFVDRPIVDKSGLINKYDMKLRWNPDGPSGLMTPSASGQNSSDDSRPSIFTALREELGLSLVPQTGELDSIDIDDVKQPSPN
jgi:uncharacterized protein (TIGR03435 family)